MITIERGQTLTIHLSGRLDSMNAEEAREQILSSLEKMDSDIILDVNRLEYISSAGLQVILQCAKTAQAHHHTCLVKGLHGTIREIFQVSGFLTFLKETE
jgi:anti-anti-sigma factor